MIKSIAPAHSTLKNMNYTSKDYPDGLVINDAAFSFNPKNISLNAAHAEYLKTHYTARARSIMRSGIC